MPEDIVVTKGSLQLRLRDPKVIKNNGGLRFVVRLEDVATATAFLDIDGFRIVKGHVYPPARKSGMNWYPLVTFSPVAIATLELKVRDWIEDFPMVEFPGD